jgi:hypothetical protein
MPTRCGGVAPMPGSAKIMGIAISPLSSVWPRACAMRQETTTRSFSIRGVRHETESPSGAMTGCTIARISGNGA